MNSEEVAQGFIQSRSENLKGQIFHKPFGQCVPVFDCPLAEYFSMSQVRTIVSQLPAMHLSKTCFHLLEQLLLGIGIGQNYLNRK